MLDTFFLGEYARYGEGSNAPNLAWCIMHRIIQRCQHNRLSIYLTLMVHLNISQHSSLCSSPPCLSHSFILHHEPPTSPLDVAPSTTIVAHHHCTARTRGARRISSFSRPLVLQASPHTEYWWQHNRTTRTRSTNRIRWKAKRLRCQIWVELAMA